MNCCGKCSGLEHFYRATIELYCHAANAFTASDTARAYGCFWLGGRQNHPLRRAACGTA